MSAPHAMAVCLAEHAWLVEAFASDHGALLLLNDVGLAALHAQGRQQLIENFQTHLAAHAFEPAHQLRLLDAMPDHLDELSIDLRLQSPRPDRVVPLREHAQDDRWTLLLQLPLELIHFDGHFPRAPVLPGVLQVGWALAFAAPRLGTSLQCREMEALKFQRLLRPGDRVELTLYFADEPDGTGRGKLYFAYHLDGAHCSSGRLRVERA
ncbi:hypothetical protein [Rhodanobacter sp. L36]|uniref:ApeI family dehydratase n=1 Tax=Rhodanobacter sp. L36 TaxID=1747221 RepID=UPI0020B17422|nr:hypothetical protein [Rhodanobacter sp. L36]